MLITVVAFASMLKKILFRLNQTLNNLIIVKLNRYGHVCVLGNRMCSLAVYIDPLAQHQL